MTYGAFLTSSSFAVDVAENWQSEFLQFTLYILATVYLVQRGSSESKELGKAGPESDAEQKVAEHAGPGSPSWAKRRGWRLAVYPRSLQSHQSSVRAERSKTGAIGRPIGRDAVRPPVSCPFEPAEGR